jgi:hypothetical protein
MFSLFIAGKWHTMCKVEVIVIVCLMSLSLSASSMYGHDVKRWYEQFIMRPSLINDNNKNQNKNLSLQ